MNTNVIYFAHGKDSQPWGTKITRLAVIAKAKGFSVESPDYTFTKDPDKRVEKLLSLDPRVSGRLILVGSSMGGYVSAVASKTLNPDGLFLMAPAFYIKGYAHAEPKPYARRTVVIHGWRDQVIPVEHAIRFSKEYAADLHIFDAEHALIEALPKIEQVFGNFLDEVLAIN